MPNMDNKAKQNTMDNACRDAAELCKGLNQFREKRMYCDVELQIEDEIYPCHKIVIANSSHYFNTMFNSSFQEKDSHVISLSGDFDPSVFKEVLEFLYTADTNITVKNVFGLLRSSHYLQIEKLEEKCCNYILNNPNIENLLEIAEYCTKIEKKHCAEVAVKYTVSKLELLRKSEYFSKISYTMLSSILKQAKQRGFPVSPRQDYIDAIFEWMKSSWVDRKCYLKDLMRNVVPSNDFSIPFLETFSELLSLNNQVVSYPPLEIFGTTEKSFFGINKFIYNESSCVWGKYICENVKNFKVARFDSCDYYLYLHPTSNKEYFFGKDRSEDDTVVKLSIPPVYYGSVDITIANRKMFLYYFGDYGEPTLLQYQFSNNRWYSLAKLPDEKHLIHSYLVSLDEIVYLIGRSKYNLHMSRNIIQCYDERSPNWTVKSMNENFVMNGTACVHRNEIYIYEEPISKQGCLYIYNPVAGKLRSVDKTYSFTTPGILISSDHELWYLEKNAQGGIYSISNKNEYMKLYQMPLMIDAASGSTILNEIQFARFC